MTSGPTLTEARRHELGQRRLQLRMAEVDIERLDKLAKAWGLTRSKVVRMLLGLEQALTEKRAAIAREIAENEADLAKVLAQLEETGR